MAVSATFGAKSSSAAVQLNRIWGERPGNHVERGLRDVRGAEAPDPLSMQGGSPLHVQSRHRRSLSLARVEQAHMTGWSRLTATLLLAALGVGVVGGSSSGSASQALRLDTNKRLYEGKLLGEQGSRVEIREVHTVGPGTGWSNFVVFETRVPMRCDGGSSRNLKVNGSFRFWSPEVFRGRYDYYLDENRPNYEDRFIRFRAKGRVLRGGRMKGWLSVKFGPEFEPPDCVSGERRWRAVNVKRG
jgi:hypothetical protein